ncbi:uncharacterized protein AB9W97_006795 [Spinachia spinachia]
MCLTSREFGLKDLEKRKPTPPLRTRPGVQTLVVVVVKPATQWQQLAGFTTNTTTSAWTRGRVLAGGSPGLHRVFPTLSCCSAGNHEGCSTCLKNTGWRVRALGKVRFSTSWTCEPNSTHWTDASNRGLGAMLSQQVQGVLYISRKLSEREGRYSTAEKECLAHIKWAVDSLRYYLLGRQFTLCSDHAPLQGLHRMKDTNAWISRWYLALQPFNFKVMHRLKARTVVADLLSRLGAPP